MKIIKHYECHEFPATDLNRMDWGEEHRTHIPEAQIDVSDIMPK